MPGIGDRLTTRVYRARRSGVWHWPHPDRHGLVSACTATPLDATRGLDPVAVDIRDRCAGHGCAREWDAWLVATTIGALAATVSRWHPLVGPGDDAEVAA